ncbi:MAG: substrate-binding periplasmic protein [Pseudomonadota bacterium]
MAWFWLLGLLISTCATGTGAPAPERIHYPRQEASPDSRSDYFLAVLELALSKTRATFGDYRLMPADLSMQQARALESLLSKRHVDVVWTITSREREQQLLPIRIPLDKGLYGYRVLLIRAGDQPRFDAVRQFKDLAPLVAGQGHDWPDTKILRANGLRVETNSRYISSFEMLARGRFDYFPRGVSEIGPELQQHRDLSLALEQRLLLYYPSAMYFFVNPQATQLAARLQQGLEAALADGSFDHLFNRHPAMQEALRLLQQERLLLTLSNPLLPEQTPVNVARYWYRPPGNR